MLQICPCKKYSCICTIVIGRGPIFMLLICPCVELYLYYCYWYRTYLYVANLSICTAVFFILPIFFQIFLATRLPGCRRNLDSDKDMEINNLRIGKSYLDAQVIQLVLLDDNFSLMSMVASTGLVVCEAAIG